MVAIQCGAGKVTHIDPATREALMAKPVVRLVTPTDPGDARHSSLDAFEHELKTVLRWDNTKADYKPYYGRYNQGTLTTVAQTAVDEAQAAIDAGERAVIVAAGTMATTILQGKTPTIPIIQAAGGRIPAAQNNVTGFHIDALGVAQYHLDNVNSQNVTILFDDTNDPSNPSLWVYNHLQAKGKNITPLPIKFSNPNGLKTLPVGSRKTSFMLIPNAMYYNHLDDIRAYVDGNVASIYYPEREYKKAHTNIVGVKLHGHNIQLTYRWAANYVESILNGSVAVPKLPPFREAIPDQDDY
jgi:hypothetical protein